MRAHHRILTYRKGSTGDSAHQLQVTTIWQWKPPSPMNLTGKSKRKCLVWSDWKEGVQSPSLHWGYNALETILWYGATVLCATTVTAKHEHKSPPHSLIQACDFLNDTSNQNWCVHDGPNAYPWHSLVKNTRVHSMISRHWWPTDKECHSFHTNHARHFKPGWKNCPPIMNCCFCNRSHNDTKQT